MTATRHKDAPRKVDSSELHRQLGERSVRVVDVRTPAEFEASHIAGSYNVPLSLLRKHRAELVRHLDDDVVLMCLSGARSAQAQEALGEAGLPGLRVLDGGLKSWVDDGNEVVEGRQTWDLERQVRFTAGSIVGAAVIGSTLYPPLKWLAAGVGGGLVFAAVSNTCAMGSVLMKMPWNNTDQTVSVSEVVDRLTQGTRELTSVG